MRVCWIIVSLVLLILAYSTQLASSFHHVAEHAPSKILDDNKRWNPDYSVVWPQLMHATLNHERTSLVPKRRTLFPTTFRLNASTGTSTKAEDYDSFLVTDSLHVDNVNRPSLWKALNNPRDQLAMLVVAVGLVVSACNVLGRYSDDVYLPLQSISVALGLASAFFTLGQVVTGYQIDESTNSRRLLASDRNVNIYAGFYALAVSWLALRASGICPSLLTQLDGILPWFATAVFSMSAIVPAITLWNPGKLLSSTPALSETELVRLRGLLAIGLLACVFAPDCVAFALGGSDWWDRVTSLHTSQSTLESSTAMFALYANEASMISHRCAKAGVAPFRIIVPVFAIVCLLLAIIPCVAALFWLGDDISFFSFYRE